MRRFRAREDDWRTRPYKKNTQLEKCFAQMNFALVDLAEELEICSNYPTLFIFGLPRSGTTLSYQLIAQCLKLGYINNLIARFWLAPQYGIALSQEVLGPPREALFYSDLGQTNGPHGPHEFGYFWQHWLKISNVDDMLIFDNSNPEIDWLGLGRTVRGMQQMFGTGIVFKTMHAPNHIRAFAETFSLPLFIYVERDPIDVALSILAARKAIYGRSDIWWSKYSPDYYSLARQKSHHQIAGQVLSLGRIYEEMISLIPPELVVRLQYSRLCEAPRVVVDYIRARVEETYGSAIELRLTPPKRFQFRTRPDVLDDEQKAVVSAVRTGVR